LPADMSKISPVTTAPPIMSEDKLKENWSRIPHC